MLHQLKAQRFYTDSLVLMSPLSQARGMNFGQPSSTSICVDLPESLSLADGISAKILCTGSNC